jgi:hypothetical protein
MQDKRKEKLPVGRKETRACEKCVKKNQTCTRKKEKRGCSSRSGDFSNAQNRFRMEKNFLGR